jgi:DNA ligase-associated metallophosphoesterase
MRIEIASTAIELLPAPGVWLPETRDLVVADVHLGKSAAFRARGIPVPEGETAADLDRLRAIAHQYQAARIIVAGDLVHAPASLGGGFVPQLVSWIGSLESDFLLIEGNHDRHSGRLPLPTVSHLDVGGIRIVHDPGDLAENQAGIAGHLHPSLRLSSSPRSSLRQPCFRLRGSHLVVPAFGSFTGTHPLTPEPGDRHFAALRDKLVEIPYSLASKGLR